MNVENSTKLLDYYSKTRIEAERVLNAIREASTCAAWLKGLRDILPTYIALENLADEARYGVGPDEDANNLVPLSRFVDERKARH